MRTIIILLSIIAANSSLAQNQVKEFFTTKDTSIVEWKTSPVKDTLVKQIARIDTLKNVYILTVTESKTVVLKGHLYIRYANKSSRAEYLFYDTAKKKYVGRNTYIIGYFQKEGILTYIDD